MNLLIGGAWHHIDELHRPAAKWCRSFPVIAQLVAVWRRDGLEHRQHRFELSAWIPFTFEAEKTNQIGENLGVGARLADMIDDGLGKLRV